MRSQRSWEVADAASVREAASVEANNFTWDVASRDAAATVEEAQSVRSQRSWEDGVSVPVVDAAEGGALDESRSRQWTASSWREHVRVRNTFLHVSCAASETSNSQARQSAPDRLQATRPPPGLEPLSLGLTVRSCDPLAELLDSAFSNLDGLLRDLDSNCMADSMQHFRKQAQALADTGMGPRVGEWIHRESQPMHGLHGQQAWDAEDAERRALGRRTLLAGLVLDVEPLLGLLASTADEIFSTAVYDALVDYHSILGLAETVAQTVVQHVLTAEPKYSGVMWYKAGVRLLGNVLRGTAGKGEASWAAAVGLLEGAPTQSLLDRAVALILDTAGWWHKRHFHKEWTVALLHEAFTALLYIFEGAPGLGDWEKPVHQLVNRFLTNYRHMEAAFGEARVLLERKGAP